VLAAVLHPLSLLLLFVFLRPTLRAAAESAETPVGR
jgi:hypothetical protein